jgi:hypothetical protein
MLLDLTTGRENTVLPYECHEGNYMLRTRSAGSARKIARLNRPEERDRSDAPAGAGQHQCPADRAGGRTLTRLVGDRAHQDQAELEASGQDRADDDLPANKKGFHGCTPLRRKRRKDHASAISVVN